jgi:hypothetical protein
MDSPIGSLAAVAFIFGGIAAYYFLVMRRARRVGGGNIYGLASGEGVTWRAG